MNEHIRALVRESHLDVYGLGADRKKWEHTIDKFTAAVIEEVFAEMARQMFLHCEVQASDAGYQKAMANTLKKFSAAERIYHVSNTNNPVDFPRS